jgi:lipoprotein-releasing system permease protein
MNTSLLARIAFSMAIARWRQTMIAAFGVTFSITMFIALLGFMNGLNDLLDGMILNRTPHIKLYNELKASENQPIETHPAYSQAYPFIRSVKPNASRKKLYNVDAIMHHLKEDHRVMGMAPKIAAQVFYSVGAIDVTGVINGIDVEGENRLFNFSEYVVAGDYIDLDHVPNSIILGKSAAEQMLVNIGDIVQVTTTTGLNHQLKVVGFFQSGINDIDKINSYASLATTQKLLGETRDFITDLQVKLTDINLAPAMAREYEHLFEVDAEDIQTANAQFETGSDVRSIISYAVGITLLIVAGFGIYNILNMMIYEKMDSIAILKATGFSGQDVRNIFLMIALSIGIAGVAFGLLFGFGLSLLIDQIPFITAALPSITTFPVNYDLKYYLIGTVFGLVTTYLAGYLPSRKASKVDPVIIIRGK